MATKQGKATGCVGGCFSMMFGLVVVLGLMAWGGFSVLGWIVNEVKNAPPLPPWNERDDSIYARYTAEEAVRKLLKSPSTAKFPGAFNAQGHVTKAPGEQVYRVRSWVEAQNSFGVTLRYDYRAEIEQFDKDRWRVNSVEIVE